MKRPLVVLAAGLLLAAALAGPVAAQEKPTALRVAAAATRGHAARIHVNAVMVHVPRSVDRTAYAVVAIAHFSTGDVTVTLRRVGRSLVATGSIPVPTGNTATPVIVDVTATLGGVSYTVSKSVRVRVRHRSAAPNPPGAAPTPRPSVTPPPTFGI